MRLLKVQGSPYGGAPLQISLCEKIGKDIPPYAILSHRWREDEVLFADMINPDPSVARSKKGWAKLEAFCRTAWDRRLQYAWMDTCCIDKTSSAELSEAINSMYNYYSRSFVCIVYLDDVEKADGEEMRASEWFTRAWTLQELIAPKKLEVYSWGWERLGNKETLLEDLSVASHIPVGVINDLSRLQEISIAQKMCWAAWREATREEDEAYSLMGIFDVHMPPLYGEGGENAFRRLQLEVMKEGHDHTLFAWDCATTTGDLLARSARNFLSTTVYSRMDIGRYFDLCIKLQPDNTASFSHQSNLDYNMTNIGLRIELPVAHLGDNKYLALIACHPSHSEAYVGIYLEKEQSGQYIKWFRTDSDSRTLADSIDLQAYQFTLQTLWISQRGPPRRGGGKYKFRMYCYSTAKLLSTQNLIVPPSVRGYLVVGQAVHNVMVLDQYYWKDEPEVVTFLIEHGPNRVALNLVTGTLNDRPWILPRINRHPKYGNPMGYVEFESKRLQKQCSFPGGWMWRHERQNFRFVEPIMKDKQDTILPYQSCGAWEEGSPWWWNFEYSDRKQLFTISVKTYGSPF